MSLDENLKDIAFTDKTELGEAFGNLDNDTQDEMSGLSNIDFNTRLSRDEVKAITIIDELTRIGLFSADWGLTRQIKRLSVSIEGKGRTEKVEMARGLQEARGGGGFLSKMFTPRQ